MKLYAQHLFKGYISVLYSGNNSRIAIEWKKNDYRSIALFSFITTKEAMPLLD